MTGSIPPWADRAVLMRRILGTFGSEPMMEGSLRQVVNEIAGTLGTDRIPLSIRLPDRNRPPFGYTSGQLARLMRER